VKVILRGVLLVAVVGMLRDGESIANFFVKLITLSGSRCILPKVNLAHYYICFDLIFVYRFFHMFSLI
jgi:hypothetical protein